MGVMDVVIGLGMIGVALFVVLVLLYRLERGRTDRRCKK